MLIVLKKVLTNKYRTTFREGGNKGSIVGQYFLILVYELVTQWVFRPPSRRWKRKIKKKKSFCRARPDEKFAVIEGGGRKTSRLTVTRDVRVIIFRVSLDLICNRRAKPAWLGSGRQWLIDRILNLWRASDAYWWILEILLASELGERFFQPCVEGVNLITAGGGRKGEKFSVMRRGC